MVEGGAVQEEAMGGQGSDYTKLKVESHENEPDRCKADGSIQCH